RVIVDSPDKNETTYDVSYRHRNEVPVNKLAPGHIRTCENTGWNKIHIGNAVFETRGHKGHDWKPYTEELSDHVLRGKGEKNCNVNKQVAGNPLHESRPESHTADCHIR